ncbi:hypothetical protein EMCRGX_G012372 [Ephydatia muelleri]
MTQQNGRSECTLICMDGIRRKALEDDFIILHPQAYTHWLSQLYLTTTRQHHTEDTVACLVGTVIKSATPLIARDNPEMVVLVGVSASLVSCLHCEDQYSSPPSHV